MRPIATKRPDTVIGGEKWRIVWRNGIAHQLSTPGLLALAKALTEDSSTLLQGVTCYPPLMDFFRDQAVLAADAIGFACWQGDGISTVGELEGRFQEICTAADLVFNEPAACRYFLNHYDDTPRENMRIELLPEVQLEIKRRKEVADGIS